MIHSNKSIQDSSACGYNGEMNLTQKYVFSGLNNEKHENTCEIFALLSIQEKKRYQSLYLKTKNFSSPPVPFCRVSDFPCRLPKINLYTNVSYYCYIS